MNRTTSVSRRTFLAGAGMTAMAYAARPTHAMAQAAKAAGFKIAVITDEISQDFDHACSVAAKDFGMHWVELRAMWGKNIMALSDAEIAEARKTLAKYNLQVTDIASPLFKVDWPGAPRSQYSPKTDSVKSDTFKADFTFAQQEDLMKKAVGLAKQFQTNKVRGFDFWRLDDQTPYRAAIDAKLNEAAKYMGSQGVLFVLENEYECNTATARESVRTLGAVKSPSFVLNWDPANAVMRGELDAFPVGWELLPKSRIRHCHVKNAAKDANGKIQWAPVGTGYIDWKAQFAALHKIGYHDAVSLETHWKGDSGPEASTRTSWDGMRKALDASANA